MLWIPINKNTYFQKQILLSMALELIYPFKMITYFVSLNLPFCGRQYWLVSGYVKMQIVLFFIYNCDSLKVFLLLFKWKIANSFFLLLVCLLWMIFAFKGSGYWGLVNWNLVYLAILTTSFKNNKHFVYCLYWHIEAENKCISDKFVHTQIQSICWQYFLKDC